MKAPPPSEWRYGTTLCDPNDGSVVMLIETFEGPLFDEGPWWYTIDFWDMERGSHSEGWIALYYTEVAE